MLMFLRIKICAHKLPLGPSRCVAYVNDHLTKTFKQGEAIEITVTVTSKELSVVFLVL